MHRVLLYRLLRAVLVVAIDTDRPRGRLAMFGGRVVVNVVTSDAGDIAAIHYYIARAVKDVIPGLCQIGKIDLEVGEEVAARHEVVGVRQAVRFRLAIPQVTLRADRDDLLGILGMLLGEPDQRRVVGVILRRHAVAGIAIERRRGETVSLRVHRRRVTARATQRKGLLVPGLAI